MKMHRPPGTVGRKPIWTMGKSIDLMIAAWDVAIFSRPQGKRRVRGLAGAPILAIAEELVKKSEYRKYTADSLRVLIHKVLRDPLIYRMALDVSAERGNEFSRKLSGAMDSEWNAESIDRHQGPLMSFYI